MKRLCSATSVRAARGGSFQAAVAGAVLSAAALATPAPAQIHCDQQLCRPDCPGCQALLEGAPGAALAPMPGGAYPGGELPEGISGDFQQPPAPAPQFPSPATGEPPASAMAGLPGGYGATGAGFSGAPSMIGDFFGNGYNYQVFNNASVATAGGDRRFKYAENNSPFLLDRVFFNYNHFHNAVVDVAGRDRDVDRYLFGIEKTLFNRTMSVELRVPIVDGLDARQSVGSLDTQDAEFGNMSLAIKRLLWSSPGAVISGGMGIVFPTGPDAPILSGGQTQIVFQNESYHLQPFLAAYFAPRARSFHLLLMQWDFDVTGSDVIVPSNSALLSGRQASVLTDQTLWYIDYAYGFWLLRNPHARYLRGLAPMVELHYTTTLEDQEYGAFQGQGIFVEDPRRDVLNMTGGLFFQLGGASALKVAGSAPLRDGRDKLYDAELGVQFIRLY